MKCRGCEKEFVTEIRYRNINTNERFCFRCAEQDKKSKNKMSEFLREEIATCSECMDLKRKNLIPGVCQYHLDMSMKEYNK